MNTPGFIPYPINITDLYSERKMSKSTSPAAPEVNGSGSHSVTRSPTSKPPGGAADSATVQGLDMLYERLSSASLSLKSLSPTLPAEGAHQSAPLTAPATFSKASTNGSSSSKPESPHQVVAAAAVYTTGPSSLKGADSSSRVPNQDTKTQNPGECDPECACQRVLLAASPGACGVCGGRPPTLSKLNDERLRALDDLEIATQRINELAHEKARHVDYIADLETRVSEQAKKIDQQRDSIAGLKNDLSAMNDKFVDQVNMTAEIAHSRELVEAELEDLTQKLFTEANTMVAAEKKARADVEKTATHLRNVIADLETRLSGETMQSQELKERIEKMSAEYDDLLLKRTMVSSRRGSIGSHMSDMAGGDCASLRREGSSIVSSGPMAGSHGDAFRLAVHSAAIIAGTKAHPTSPSSSSHIRLDDQLVAEFKEFAVNTQSQRYTNYMNMPYMKSVVSADVEPCLRFGSQPRISSRNVLDSIASNRIQIEEMTPQIAAEMRRLQQASDRSNANRHALLWERLSGTVASNPYGCQACGRECNKCTYRFRMGYRPDSEWIQIDTICRDRLVAVCEFYGFVRYLRQGIFSSRSTMELYMETIRLRLSMFYASIGAYGYAIDLDPCLAEAPPFLRNPNGGIRHPDSPTTLSHGPSGSHASAMTEPYINSNRAASAANVAIWQDSARTPSNLAIDASDAVNRLRSRSQETSALPSSVPSVSIPPPVALSSDEPNGDAGHISQKSVVHEQLPGELPLSTVADAATDAQPAPTKENDKAPLNDTSDNTTHSSPA
ncbi:RAB3A interacting protein [Coemansia sp. RSA 988]|nr:RAB3A interacting protein [Coemansia sp. RSA 988]